MKLLFIYPYGNIVANSVQKKVSAQIQHLNTSASTCRGVFITTASIQNKAYTDNIDFEKINSGKWKYFQNIEIRIRYLKRIITILKRERNNYDYFIMRYPNASFSLFWYMLSNKKNIVFEHVTDEVLELKLFRKENKLKFNLSSILSSFEQLWYPFLYEKLFQSTLNSRAKYLLYNSAEIASHQLKEINPEKVLISGDAVDPKEFRLKKINPIKDSINLVFLKGASTSALFNGLDRIIKSIIDYQGKYKINFYIVGNNLKYEASLVPSGNSSIILMNALYGEELDDFLDQMHIGVATLGLFRKGLNATTTIKVREYFARGLPFIYAYSDSDLEKNVEAMNYALQFPNDETLFQFDLVVDFAIKQNANDNHSNEMRSIAEKYFSFKVKMERVIQFLQKEV